MASGRRHVHGVRGCRAQLIGVEDIVAIDLTESILSPVFVRNDLVLLSLTS